jgi:hypothetical protein
MKEVSGLLVMGFAVILNSLGGFTETNVQSST